ncbi:MAG: hypothetical protein OXH02_15670 [Gemmatimonadetes bacterium]|nr:hypothetical protein [Gemmatimonadota bacterium]
MTKVVKRRSISSQTQFQFDEHAIRDFRQRILIWYRQNGRQFRWRQAKSCYERIIAELLLQRTQANTIAKFYKGFIERFPSWNKLARATEEDLRALLLPIGLWRRRARSMMALASEMAKTQGQLPTTRDELERLPGISQYLASSILLLCHGKREALIDVNMARVLERVFGKRNLADIRYDPYLQELARTVVSAEDPIACNWAIIDLAAAVCHPNTPKCSRCPVNQICAYVALQ